MADRLGALARELRGAGDTAWTIGKSALAQPIAGVMGLSDLLRGRGLDAAVKRIEDVEGMAGGPSTPEGARNLQAIGEGVDWVGEKLGHPIQRTADTLAEVPVVGPALAAGALGFTEVADPTKIAGKASKAGKAAKRAAEVAKATGPVERSSKALAAAGLEPDIVRSIMTDPKFKATEGGVPAEVVQTARENRAKYREEPRTLPKPATEMSDQDWVDFGAKHGVDFSQTPMKSLGVSDLKTKREIMTPGGLEGKFTIPDLFRIKAENFDPAALGQETHNKLMAKFLRTFERPGGSDPVDIYNDLNFSLLSPNAPLTQNQFIAQRSRLRTPEDLEAMAQRGRTEPAGTSRLDPEGLWGKLDTEYGTGAASRGGLGVGGTANLGNQGMLAKLLRQKPEMFQAGEGETLRDVGYRIMNQVPGLSVKTASLGIPWSDLSKANTSAVDLHMIRHGRHRLEAEDPEFKAALEKRIASKPGTDPEEAAIELVSTHPSPVYRKATGELHEDLPSYLQPEKLAYEPTNWSKPSVPYQKIMGYVDESRGANPAHELFPEQWRKWDVYRGRVEPHEMSHPDFRKLPKQSFSELQDALTAHKEAGYMGSPSEKGKLYPTDVDTSPVPKQTDWRKLYYGGLAGAGTAGALAQLLRGQPPEDERSQ